MFTGGCDDNIARPSNPSISTTPTDPPRPLTPLIIFPISRHRGPDTKKPRPNHHPTRVMRILSPTPPPINVTPAPLFYPLSSIYYPLPDYPPIPSIRFRIPIVR